MSVCAGGGGMNLGGEVRSLERVSEGVTTEDLGGGSGLVNTTARSSIPLGCFHYLDL